MKNIDDPFDRDAQKAELRAERYQRDREIEAEPRDLAFVESACEWFDERDKERGLESEPYTRQEVEARRREQSEE